MDFFIQDAGMMYMDFPMYPNELHHLIASTLTELAIIFIFVRYFVLWLWELPLHLA